jgi:hypothetical protein
MQQPSLDFADICSRKHHNNQNSVAANKRADRGKPQWRYLCLDYIRRSGTATSAEICAHYGKTPNALSGRLSELKAAKLIEETGETRQGCAVLRPVT